MQHNNSLHSSIIISSLFKNDTQPAGHHEMKNKLFALGLIVDIKKGHLFYIDQFKPCNYDFELVFIRHGETYGNCGQTTSKGEIDQVAVNMEIRDHTKRIYQGNVDSAINQLTERGKQQALKAAILMEDQFLAKGWIPDIILYSPLTRAKETGLPFVERNQLHEKYVMNENIREMSFGVYDNCRICDIEPNDPCHSFYQDQHALVKNLKLNGNDSAQAAEHFCDVILRAHQVLQQLQSEYARKKILMFSHSIFGAACCILLGKGKKMENKEYLAFDGQQKDGQCYTIPHATPFFLNAPLSLSKYRRVGVS